MNIFSNIDFLILVCYLVVCCSIAFYKMWGVKTIREYAIGGKSITSGMLVATFFATSIGGGRSLSALEHVYMTGITFSIALLLQPVMWLLMSKFFATARLMEFKRAGCLSISDIMEYLYGTPGRWVSNISGIFISVAMNAVQVVALGHLFETFFGMDLVTSTGIVFGIICVYSMCGGMRAIVISDTLQALIIIIALPIVCFWSYYEIGGVSGAMKVLPREFFFPVWEMKAILSLIATALLMIGVMNGTYIQRLLMADNPTELKRVFTSLFFSYIPLSVILVALGIAVRVKYSDIDPSSGFYHLVDQYFAPGMRGFIIVGIFAVIMSASYSWLNTASVLCAHDIYKKLYPSVTQKSELRIARISVPFIGMIACLIAFYSKSSMSVLHTVGSNFFTPIIYVPLLAGFSGLVSKPGTFITSALCGMTSVLISAYVSAHLNGSEQLFNFDAASNAIGVIFSGIGLLVAHTLDRMREDKRLFERYFNNLYKICMREVFGGGLLGRIRRLQLKSREVYYYMGIFGFTYYTVAIMSLADAGAGSTDLVLWLRVGGLILSFILCVHELYVPSNHKIRYMGVVWYFTLIYCLAFLSVYSLILSGLEVIWFVHLGLSIILLWAMTNGIITILISLVGLSSALMLFNYTGGRKYVIELEFSYTVILGYLCSVIATLYLLHRRGVLEYMALRAKVLYCSATAQEVKQPLTSMLLVSEVYDKVLSQSPSAKSIPDYEYKKLGEFNNNLKRANNRAALNLDALMSVISDDLEDLHDSGVYNISEPMIKAIADYAPNRAEHQKINVDFSKDFEFYGSFAYIRQVMAVFLSNSLRHPGRDAAISIWCDDETRTVHFKDNGKWLPRSQVEIAYHTDLDTTFGTEYSGVCLAFCKRVMESLGGSIRDCSKLGKYTEFVLTFPDPEEGRK